MTDTSAETRHIPDRLDTPLRAAVFSWPALLLLVAVALLPVRQGE